MPRAPARVVRRALELVVGMAWLVGTDAERARLVVALVREMTP